MRLTKVKITNYKSIIDSNEFEIGDITCLVGKNESGKTALLEALYKLNPINKVDGEFVVEKEYPRSAMIAYQEGVKNGERNHADVVRATYELEEEDIEAMKSEFRELVFVEEIPKFTISKNYGNKYSFAGLNLCYASTLANLLGETGLDQAVIHEVSNNKNLIAPLGKGFLKY